MRLLILETQIGRSVGYKGPLTCDNDADGYLVDYGNGYLSWSPRDVFEESYRATSGVTFGLAVEALKKRHKVTRAGWNGKEMFLLIIQGSNDIAKLTGYGFGEYLDEPTFRDAIFMKTVDDQLVPWTASQSDILADDWTVIE